MTAISLADQTIVMKECPSKCRNTLLRTKPSSPMKPNTYATPLLVTRNMTWANSVRPTNQAPLSLVSTE
jgi:hypothetical protein